jgi:DNA polymerase delta subunit 1
MVQRTNLWQYQGTTSRPYLKITTALPNMVAPARGALEDGVRCSDGRQLPSLGSYESNVLYALRFMVDTSMGGGQWLEVPAGVPVGYALEAHPIVTHNVMSCHNAMLQYVAICCIVASLL